MEDTGRPIQNIAASKGKLTGGLHRPPVARQRTSHRLHKIFKYTTLRLVWIEVRNRPSISAGRPLCNSSVQVQ
jgi:hypothetical protein